MPVADDVVWLDVLPSMNRFRPELQKQAAGAADGAGKDAGEKFTGSFARHLKVGAVIGGALAVGGAFKFMQEATREASNLGESLNAVKVTFGDAAGGINELGKAAATSVGLSQSQFNGLAVQFSAFATSIAGEGGDVTGVMKDLTTRGADFASVMNLDVNTAMETFQSGLAGETEPLRKYGIDLSAAAVENYALANGIIKSGETMTEAQKVQARYGSLMEQTSKVQGDFANTSGSLANSQRILSARWDDIQAVVGGKVIPILERFSGWVAGPGLAGLQTLGTWIQTTLGPIFNEVVGGIRAFGAAWMANDGDITSSGFPGFMERIAFIGRGLWGFLSGTLIPTLRDMGAAILPVLGTAFRVVGDAVLGTLTFFRQHETAAKVLGGVVAVVAGLVAAAWVAQATVSAVNSAKSVIAWMTTATASTTSATIQSRSTAQIVFGWIAASAAAVVNAAKVAAAWALSVAQTGILMAMYAGQSIAAAASSTAAWLAAQARTVLALVMTGASFVAQGAVMAASMAATAARVVAGWVLMGIQSMLAAAKMAAAWFIALGPIGWVIAAVIGLVALIIANWDTVVRWTKIAWDAVMTYIRVAWDWIKNATKATWDWISGVLSAAFDFMRAIFMSYVNFYISTAQFLWDRIKAIFTWLRDSAVSIFTNIKDSVILVWTVLRDAVVSGAQFLWDLVTGIFTRARDGWVRIFTAIKDTVVGVWTTLRDAVVNGAQNVWTWVTDKFNAMRNGVVGIFEGIRDTVGRVWDGLQDKVKTPIRLTFDFVNNNMVNPLNAILSKFPGGLRIPNLPRLSGGGLLRGPGTGTSDSILGIDPRTGVPTAAVSNGEYVVKRSRVREVGVGWLDAFNEGRIPGLATGGLAGRFRVPARGLGGWLSDRWDDTKGIAAATWDQAKNAVSSVKNFSTDMIAKGARKAAEAVLGPITRAAKELIPNQVPLSLLSGGLDKLYDAVLGKGDEKDKEVATLATDVNFTSGGGRSPNGVGGLGPVAQAARQDVMRRFGLTNIGGYSYRKIAGTNTLSDHALGKAIDVMIPNYKSAAGIAKGNEVANYFTSQAVAKQYGVKYVIWKSRINQGKGWLPYGHPGGGRSDTLQHEDHNHVSFYDKGGYLPPGLSTVFNGTGRPELVAPPETFRQVMAEGAGAMIGQLHLHEVAYDPSDSVAQINRAVRVVKTGGRYAGVGAGS